MRPAIALCRKGLARVRVRPRRGRTRSASEVARSRLRGLPYANLRGLPHATQSQLPRVFTTASLSGSEIAHTRWATGTQHNIQPETPKGSWTLLLPRRRHRRRRCCCCCCAATVLLLLHDPRCIAEHKPSQQTAVSRFVFLGTHAEASNGTAAAAAAAAVAVAAAAAAAAQQQ